MTIHISYDMLGLLVGLFLFGLCVGVGGGWAAYTWRRARPVAPEFDLVGILEESLVAIYVVLEGRVLYVNKAMRNLLRYDDVSEIVGRQAMDFTLPADHRLFQEMHQKRMSGEMGIGSYSYRALCKDGVALPISVTGGMVNYKGALALVGMAYDATAQWEAERKSNLANQVFNSAAEGIIITDANFKIEAVNPAFTEITGYQSCESVGRISNLLRGRHRDPHFQERLREILEHKGHWVGEMQDRRKNGQWYPAWLSISTVYDHARNASNFVYVFTDHTRRKETETRLLDLASRDSLTGLYNRASFLDGLDRRIQEGQAHQRRLAVYFIDLDRFKGVNDTLGHEIGDLLLIEIATRMRSTLREHDMAARIGGDEFVVVFDDMQSTEHAIQVAKRLIAALVRPTKIKEHEIFVTASIGWATCPEDGVTADELLRNADIAMYQAKAGGRDSYCAFHEEMIGPTKRRVNIESKLLRALDRGEFTLVYQPQVACFTGKLVGVEALIRWKTADGKHIPPAEFIPMAEENGQIAAIGEWVLNKACQQMRRWKDSDNRVPRIAVNLSPRQLLWPDLIPGILTALRDNALEPSCLELEITEGAITNYTQEVIDILSKIREIGVSLAIDDFGTGYSSLSVLKHAPVDRIKIDRSFVQGLPDDADDAAITEAIVAIAQKMKLQVVAEGVESLVQLQYLQDAGCDVIQGYFTGYPMTVEQFDRYLADSVAEKRRWRTCWRAERPWGAGSTLGGGAATYHYLPANFLR